MVSLHKKMLFLGLLLGVSQGACAAAGKIGLPCQKQATENQVQSIENQVSKPVSFVEAVQNGQPTGLPEVKEKYADKVLKENPGAFRCLGQKFFKGILYSVLTALTGNSNLSITMTQLVNEGLIYKDLFSDTRILQFHKNATWLQYYKVNGVPPTMWFTSLSSVDYSDHVSGMRKFLYTVGWLPIVAIMAVLKKDSKGQDEFAPEQAFLCYINYIVAELVRQKMITPEESPRMANVVAILLAGSMNEVVKKVA